MATCPQCGRFLDDRHRCTGMWRLRLGVARTVLVGGLVGAAGGGIVMATIFGGASTGSVAVTGLVGAIVVWAFLRGAPPSGKY